MTPRPVASVSLDLDDRWSYMKTHGQRGWEAHPTYLDVAVPRILEHLARRGLSISFFVVGQDADRPANRSLLRSIADAGHEIGNHSYRHEPWLHLYTETELHEEVAQAEEAILVATGVRPVGFRGPGFSLSRTTLEVLARRGYAYDASLFPNLLNPLARAYFFATSTLDEEERRRRAAMFGSWQDALRPVKPFHWPLEKGSLLEIPVTTMPAFRVPMHLSYILYLARFSERAARAYFRGALALCRRTGTEPSILLHPPDFLALSEAPELQFFPAMDLPLETKLRVVDGFLDDLAASFEIVTMKEHADLARGQAKRVGEASLRGLSGGRFGIQREPKREDAPPTELALDRELSPQ